MREISHLKSMLSLFLTWDEKSRILCGLILPGTEHPLTLEEMLRHSHHQAIGPSLLCWLVMDLRSHFMSSLYDISALDRKCTRV